MRSGNETRLRLCVTLAALCVYAEHAASNLTADFVDMAVEKKCCFSIDRETQPKNNTDAPKDAIRRILEEVRDVSTPA